MTSILSGPPFVFGAMLWSLHPSYEEFAYRIVFDMGISITDIDAINPFNGRDC